MDTAASLKCMSQPLLVLSDFIHTLQFISR